MGKGPAHCAVVTKPHLQNAVVVDVESIDLIPSCTPTATGAPGMAPPFDSLSEYHWPRPSTQKVQRKPDASIARRSSWLLPCAIVAIAPPGFE